MTHEETIEKSRELDRFLARSARELMPITDAKPLLSMADLIADIAAAKDEFRARMTSELAGMAADIRANGAAAVGKVREERKSVRDEFAQLLGNEIVDTSSDVKSGGGEGA